MCSSLLQLVRGSRDLSQAEKRIAVRKTEQFTKWQLFSLKMTKFIQDSFDEHYITVILFSALDKSRDPGANWKKLEHM